MVFGSSAMNLSTPESDIDLTLYLPSRVELMQELKVRSERTRSLSLPVTLHRVHSRAQDINKVNYTRKAVA